MREVARAIDACRRGWPIEVRGDGATLSLLPIETADPVRLAEFAPEGCGVLLSGERGATLALGNQRDAAGIRAVRIAAVPWLDFDMATALADPAMDLSRPLKGPFETIASGADDAADAALELARIAGLLPAFFVHDGDVDSQVTSVRASAVRDYLAPERLYLASRARLPTVTTEACEIVAFRLPEECAEHIALLIGTPNGHPPLVRLHSECLTGDVLGSLKCDCGPQLDNALAAIAASGWGILLYLRQEGRGIGLVNKLRAYALQDQGFDTVDANLRLGFPIDTRDFGIAGRMLTLLRQERVRLLTNNPEKVAALRSVGIDVVERVPHRVDANPHNQVYLATKLARTGHLP